MGVVTHTRMSRAARSALWFLWAGGLLAVSLLLSQQLAAQCPMCRTGLTQSAEGLRWARGVNAGILLLLAAPFVIAGSATLLVFRPQIAAALSRVRARLPGRTRTLSTLRTSD